MKDILYHMYKQGYPRVVVFSGTEEGNHFFSSILPAEYIHNSLDIDKVQQIIDTQKQIVAAVRDTEEKVGGTSGIDTRLLLVMDDIVFQRGALCNDTFRTIFFNGRHLNISLIVAAQYLMLIPIEHRGNIDFLFCLREPIIKNKVKLYESFFGCFPDKDTFSFVLDKLTQNYECCIFDNTKPNLEVDQCVKWYKAQLELPKFKYSTVK